METIRKNPNYLFAPFNNDDEINEVFDMICKTNEEIPYDVIILINRLKSTHHRAVTQLQAVNDGLLEESNLLKAELKDVKKVTYEKAYKEKEDLDKSFIKCLEESTKKHVAENKTIKQCYKGSKVRVKELQAENDGLAKLVVDLKAEIKLLSCDDIDDCGCVIPKEYKQEARDYMNHNPKVNKVYFFMVADDCIGDDGYAQDWSCCVDDAAAVINNE